MLRSVSKAMGRLGFSYNAKRCSHSETQSGSFLQTQPDHKMECPCLNARRLCRGDENQFSF